MSETSDILHANAVVLNGQGMLIKGASGAGKSGLTLQLMALGAQLVADDQTIVTRQDRGVWMSAPPALAGLVEARGLGILSADFSAQAKLSVVLDLDETEPDRLPHTRQISILGYSFPLLFNVSSPYFPASLVQYLIGGRSK